MDQQTLIARVTATLEPDQRIRALFLAGSFGSGTADTFSDVDLLLIADAADHEALAAAWLPTFRTIAPVVHDYRLPYVLVLNVITDEWLRCDLEIGTAKALTRAQDRLKPLIDRDGLYAGLATTTPPPQPNPERLRGMIAEFIRIIGLTPVADGRGEYELMTTGAGMLRRMLTELLIMETGKDPGGMLHLSRTLDPERMAILKALPVAHPNRDSALTASLALARAFMPRARALAASYGLDWPETFETATRAHLNRTLPAPYRADW